ncbi:MAG: aryl-sulfate sulfotransferase [bacterium]
MMFGTRAALAALLLSVFTFPSLARAQTLGLLRNEPGAYPGYTLFETLVYPTTYLIDMNGEVVHTWDHGTVIGSSLYLQDNGDLIRPASAGILYASIGVGSGLIERTDWDGNVLWEFVYSDSTRITHHDIAVLPNGNILAIARELRSLAECLQAGRNPATIQQARLWPETLIEIEPTGSSGGNIVWKWDVWDHLIQDFDPNKDNYGVVADHPELVDINYRQDNLANWLHMNSVTYDEALDQIVVSSRTLNEFWIIDHSTTTEEAAGHTGGLRGRGGDLLYRWGNPEAYDAGTLADRRLFKQHHPHWIPSGLTGAGRMMVFNNGNDRPGGPYSTVDEIVTTVDANGDYPMPASGTPHGPAAAAYSYVGDPPDSFYSSFISSAQRLPNDDTLICEGGPGRLFEIDASENILWEYVVPVNMDGPMMQGEIPMNNETRTFRARRLDPSFPGFAGRDLTPMGPIELAGTGVPILAAAGGPVLSPAFPNPFRAETFFDFTVERPGTARLDIFDIAGRRVLTLVDGPVESGRHRATWQPSGVAPGVYTVRLLAGDRATTRKVTLVR